MHDFAVAFAWPTGIQIAWRHRYPAIMVSWVQRSIPIQRANLSLREGGAVLLFDALTTVLEHGVYSTDWIKFVQL